MYPWKNLLESAVLNSVDLSRQQHLQQHDEPPIKKQRYVPFVPALHSSDSLSFVKKHTLLLRSDLTEIRSALVLM